MTSKTIGTIRALEEKAVATGFKDGFLTALFAGLATLVVQLIDWILTTGLGLLDTFFTGKWSWVKPVIVLILTAIVKGIDRKKHEDPSASTGLVKI